MRPIRETPGDLAWFVGAWRRRSIEIPGGEPTEPCEAWWLQAGEWFVDVRVAAAGQEFNGLPFSQTRAFAGRFEYNDGRPRWHVLLDSGGVTPRTDHGATIFPSRDDPLVMIEDAPGRFQEIWVQSATSHSTALPIAEDADAQRIRISVGDYRGSVWLDRGSICGAIWRTGSATPIASVESQGE